MEACIPGYGDRCVVCGKPARVHMGTASYCLDCYNHLTDYLAEVASPTNDDYSVLALDPDGRTVEFAVERFSLGTSSVWTAVEQVDEDDPRRRWGYEGRSVSVAADARTVTQEEVLDALMVKVQRLVGHASMSGHSMMEGLTYDTTATRGNEALYANETGIARITADEGGSYVVVDGQRLAPEQFVDMLSNFEGFDLYWQIHYPTDDLPSWL